MPPPLPINDEDDSVSSSTSSSSRAAPALTFEPESPVSPAAIVADDTAAATGVNSLAVDQSNLPTLLSKSPPPFSEDSDERPQVNGDFDVGLGANDDYLSSDTSSLPNESTADLDVQARSNTTNEQTHLFAPFGQARTEDAGSFPSDTFQNAFSAFETTDETTSSDWVNFDQQVDSSSWAAESAQPPVAEGADQHQPVDSSSTAVLPQTNSNEGADDDDEWSDFAEPKPFTPEFKPSIPPPVSVVKPSPLTGQMLINLDAFLEQIFAKTPGSLRGADQAASDRVPTDFPVLIDEDTVWQHIQRLTTETDASDSLQFKWKLSELETSFLSSLCLQRAPSLPKKFKTRTIPSYIYNMSNILQPTKAESPASSTVNEDKPVDEVNRTVKTQLADAISDTSSTKSGAETPAPAPAPVTTLNPSQMLDLDLSFFEKSSSSSSVKSSSSSGKGSSSGTAKPDPKQPGAKPESNSIYLNQLLQDIFHQPQASSSSSSSSNVRPSPSAKKQQEANDKNLLTF